MGKSLYVAFKLYAVYLHKHSLPCELAPLPNVHLEGKTGDTHLQPRALCAAMNGCLDPALSDRHQ